MVWDGAKLSGRLKVLRFKVMPRGTGIRDIVSDAVHVQSVAKLTQQVEPEEAARRRRFAFVRFTANDFQVLFQRSQDIAERVKQGMPTLRLLSRSAVDGAGDVDVLFIRRHFQVLHGHDVAEFVQLSVSIRITFVVVLFLR